MKGFNPNAMTIRINMTNAEILKALAAYNGRYATTDKEKELAARSYRAGYERDLKEGYFNFAGANMYRIRGSIWSINGHHPGEAYESWAILHGDYYKAS